MDRQLIDAGAEQRFPERAKTRSPQIMADAAYWILTQPSRKVTGRFFLDDEALRSSGVSDFSGYRQPGVTDEELMPDFFL